jgi:hypothetical protein
VNLRKTLSTVSLMSVRGSFLQINNNNDNYNNTWITFSYGIIIGFEHDTILATGVMPKLLRE